MHFGLGHFAVQRRDAWRIHATIGDAYPRALRAQVTRKRQPGLAETEHQYRLSAQLFHVFPNQRRMTSD
jgi:hypothetical protein